jgi:hypothetical protein
MVESGGAGPAVDEAWLRGIAGEQRGYPVPVGRRRADAGLAARHVTNILVNGQPDSAESVRETFVN